MSKSEGTYDAVAVVEELVLGEALYHAPTDRPHQREEAEIADRSRALLGEEPSQRLILGLVAQRAHDLMLYVEAINGETIRARPDFQLGWSHTRDALPERSGQSYRRQGWRRC
jgi:hypothetical protein